MKYPIGIQDFRSLREGGYVYVDKTAIIHELISSGAKYVFLSRPRRFGKSLLVSTLRELYGGGERLFEGLAISEWWDFATRRRPVIWLKFGSSGHAEIGLQEALLRMLDEAADEHDIQLTDKGVARRFSELIRTLGKRQRAVLLIDEYDKPILDQLKNYDVADANRSLLKNLFSVLKDADPYLELVFITGVTEFSKVSIFSDLNNLHNITLAPAMSAVAGITQAEMRETFAEQISTVDLAKLKRWYNGYSWGGPEKVYNPFSLLSFLKTRRYHNHWYATGTPSFLIEEMRRRKYYDVERTEVSHLQLASFNLERLNPVTVLFQTGYLTIVDYIEEAQLYVLDYPNLEVRGALQRALLELYLDGPAYDPLAKVYHLQLALESRDLQRGVDIINSLFASLPYDYWQRDDEHLFAAIIHFTFRLLGIQLKAEVHSARGRADAIVETERFIYAFEFKRDQSVDAALQQIRDRGYLEPFADSPQRKIAVGINFSTGLRQVDDWREVEL